MSDPVVEPASGETKTWAMFIHLSALSGLIGVPFGHVVGPLVLWLIKKDQNAGYKKVFDRFQKDYGFGKPDYVMYKPKGCDTCGGTGYKGRTGLHELMVGTDAVKKLIQEHARVAELFTQALTDGMVTLKMDGMEKVLQGVTDMFQVRAVCIK